MKLTLINDLPLMCRHVEPGRLETIPREWLEPLAPLLPARITYLGYGEFERLWAAIWPARASIHLLVGTRPNLLAARGRIPRHATKWVSVYPERSHDACGRTASVRVAEENLARQLARGERLCVLDDVMISGTTVLSLLDALVPMSPGAVCVRSVAATERSLRRLRAAYPGIDADAGVVLDFEPITAGTAIFLWDLLFGTLRGQPFLTQIDLLRPYFGDDLIPLHRLRAAIASSGVPETSGRPHVR